MKLSLLLALIAASTCLAQTAAKPAITVPAPQTSFDNRPLPLPQPENCPVVLTSAQLAPYLMLLREGAPEGAPGELDLKFRNASGKSISSMTLSAQVLVKQSIYDMGGSTMDLSLTAYDSRGAEGAITELRRLSLPQGIHPALVKSISLTQVTFEDGTVWVPAGRDSCSLSNDGGQRFTAR
jgi:hypothetical protein